MKTIIILALAIVFSFSSCTDDEQIKNKNISPLVSLNSDSIKSLLIGKWQMTLSGGSFSEPSDHTKDSLFLYFTDNSYYEYYKKDSLTHRDAFEIKFDKPKYYQDSNWFVVFKGYPVLEEDSTESTGYRVIYYDYAKISSLNDSSMVLHLHGYLSCYYIKMH